MYSVNRKNWENSDAESSNPLAFAPASERRRKMRIGRSGARERSSMTTNAATRAADAPRSEIVWADPQPCSVARVIA
jgi:hypothetical protein